MNYQGDYDAGTVIRFKFNTFRPSTGAPFALAGTPSLAAYKDGGDAQDTDGLTLTASFDGVDGMNHVSVDTSADPTFYSAGSSFDIVIAAGTVDGVSVVGVVVCSFTLRKDSSLKPTTAAHTLDVTATGAAGIDWANVENPSTAVNLSATNIDVNQVVASVSGAVGSVAADGISAASLAADAITEIQSGLATALSLADAQADIDTIAAAVAQILVDTGTDIPATLDSIGVLVTAIKAKSDQLNFSGANLLSDIRAVRGDAIIENGSASTNWGAAP
jgi:hypothetical protein